MTAPVALIMKASERNWDTMPARPAENRDALGRVPLQRN